MWRKLDAESPIIQNLYFPVRSGLFPHGTAPYYGKFHDVWEASDCILFLLNALQVRVIAWLSSDFCHRNPCIVDLDPNDVSCKVSDCRAMVIKERGTDAIDIYRRIKSFEAVDFFWIEAAGCYDL